MPHKADLTKVVRPGSRGLLKKRKQPRWVDPMLATLTETYFSHPDWIFEPKLDGVRCLAFKTGRKVRLMSRNELSLNDRYPEIATAVSKLDVEDAVLDGEVAVVSAGVSRFQSLQRHLLEGGGALVYFVFDAPCLAGQDLTALPLLDRKVVLEQMIGETATIQLVEHREETGEAFLQEACEKGWEGLIAKRAEAPYSGGRSKDWLKFKCSKEQEFVIGGFTDPQGARIGFGALLVGYYDGDDLRYAGKVGTGFNTTLLRSLTGRLQELERPECTFVGKPPARKNVHWVEPSLVAQVGFGEWTREGRLRHPRFLGIRDDKSPREVVRETN